MKPGSDNLGKKVTAEKAQVRKKRPALLDVTNQKNGSQSGPQASVASSKPMVRTISFL